MTPMTDHVKSRTYTSSLRAEQAARTRETVLAAARQLIVTQGYARTTVQQIAMAAGVNVDTIYHAVGRKPELLRALVESALSGTADAVPGAEREYVQRMAATSSAREKLEIYADAVTAIQQRLSPIFIALRDAALTDDACRSLWTEISERRARNMRLLAKDLRTTGEVRSDLDDDEVADIIWSMNAAEYWVLLVVERGWTPGRFRSWLSDAWCRLLL